MVIKVADTLTIDSKKRNEEPQPFLFGSLKKFFKLSLDMFFIAGFDGYFKQINPMCEKILGYTTKEFLSQRWIDFIHPEDQQSTLEQIQKLTAGTETISFENRYRCQDGSYKWLLWNASACQEEQLIYAVVHDRTHCKHLELNSLISATPENTPRQLVQEELQTAYDNLEKRVEERTAELTKTLELLQQEIAERKRTEAALRESKSRLKKQTEQLESETRHAKSLLQELQCTHAQLIQTEKMSSLGQLIAGIAHEINNPVGFIYSNVDYATCYVKDLIRLLELYHYHYPQPVSQIQAERKAIDLDFLIVDLPKLLASMKVGATRIRQVVLSLQNFLRPEQAKMKPVDIHQGLDSTLLLLQHRLKETGDRPEITVFKKYGQLPLVECFAGQINQVFMNLLTNAVDVLEVSTAPQDCQRSISISTAVEEISTDHPTMSNSQNTPHVVIRIADNGPGMTEEICHRLFEPFFTTKPVGKGTGLGLSISYHIVVERHGGQLTCNSELGKGAQFTIAIPIRQFQGDG